MALICLFFVCLSSNSNHNQALNLVIPPGFAPLIVYWSAPVHVSTSAGERHEKLAAGKRSRRTAGPQGAAGGGDTHHQPYINLGHHHRLDTTPPLEERGWDLKSAILAAAHRNASQAAVQEVNLDAE